MGKARNRVIGLVAVVAVVLGGMVLSTTAANASTASAPTANVAHSSSHRYSGETLFRAAVFGQGAAAYKLKGLTTPVAVTPEVETEIGRIVTQIETDSPSYFARFADLAQSGSALKVDQAFRQTSDVLNTALTKLGYVSGANAASVSPQCIQVVLFAVAVLVYAGAAILQVAAVAVSFWYAGPRTASTSANTNQLTREKWIASVTTALG